MFQKSGLAFAIFYLAALGASSGPTKIFVDMVSEYKSLDQCAEKQVSTVIRNMEFGCGDGSQTTSYACFCYQSSEKYARMISTLVTSACSSKDGQGKSAVEVFSKYCQIGDLKDGNSTESTSSSESTTLATSTTPTPASPSSNQATTTVSETGTTASIIATNTGNTGTTETGADTPPPQTSEPSAKKDNTAAIAAGISVPFGVIALGLLVYFLLARKKTQPRGQLSADPRAEVSTVGQRSEVFAESAPATPYNGSAPPSVFGASPPVIFEKDSNFRHEIDTIQHYEMDAFGEPRSELAGSAVESRDTSFDRILFNNGK